MSFQEVVPIAMLAFYVVCFVAAAAAVMKILTRKLGPKKCPHCGADLR